MLNLPEAQATLPALVSGDLHAIGVRLAATGLVTQVPGPGMLQVLHAPAAVTAEAEPEAKVAAEIGAPPRLRLLISVGIHGNETAPIDMMAQVLDTLLAALVQAPACLAPDLLLVVGNPDAIALASRFVDADLNRLFTAERGMLANAREAARADAIMEASAAFFDAPGHSARWHLDLHSAIRPSRYARFAVIPADGGDETQAPLIAWLGSAGIEAVMFNSQRATTFSAFTAQRFQASSCTVELGQAGVLGQHPPDQLQQTRTAILNLLQGQVVLSGSTEPVRFRVAQEIIKCSDAFQLMHDGAMHNFTALPPHAVIATDGDMVHRVGPVTEYMVFPNPKVLVGQRAGLMVVRADPPSPQHATITAAGQ